MSLAGKVLTAYAPDVAIVITQFPPPNICATLAGDFVLEEVAK